MATNRTALFSRVQPGGVFTVENVPEHPGAIWFVGSEVTAASDSDGYGKSPDMPFATLDYAIAYCESDEGDVIYVLPGHSEALTEQISVDVSGIKIIGLGDGDNRPQFTGGANSLDCIDVSADNVVIENLYFNEATVSANTSNINIDAAHCTVRRVHMDMGANDRDGFTVTADGERPTIEDCSVVVTADGPDTWVTFEGVIDRPIIRRNYIIASDGTDAFDDGVLDFGGLAITNPVVEDNMFDGADVAVACIDDVGAVVGDCFGVNRYAGSATNGDTVTNATATIGAGGIAAATFAASAIEAAAFAADALQAMQDEAEDALEGENLDHLAKTATAGADMTTEITDGSILSRILSKTADTSDYDAATDSLEALADTQVAMELCCEKSDGAVLLGDDALFVIAGGPIHILEIAGIVTTTIGGGATNVKLQLDTTEPAATVEMNAGAVDIDSDAAGTSYRSINTSGVFTPVTAGFVLMANSFATNPTEYFAPAGTIMFNSDAARDGVIKWYLRYKPLSPNSVVTAAA
ncbi:MAG: hypothetical protein WC683_12580 [bacterium]